MDKVNKQELRRLAKCASSGPWLAEVEGGRMNVANEDWYLLEMHHDQPLFMTDAAFIAAANPAAILSLLDELEQCRKDTERLDWLTEKGKQEDSDQGDVRVYIDAAMAKEGGANG